MAGAVLSAAQAVAGSGQVGAARPGFFRGDGHRCRPVLRRIPHAQPPHGGAKAGQQQHQHRQGAACARHGRSPAACTAGALPQRQRGAPGGAGGITVAGLAGIGTG